MLGQRLHPASPVNQRVDSNRSSKAVHTLTAVFGYLQLQRLHTQNACKDRTLSFLEDMQEMVVSPQQLVVHGICLLCVVKEPH